MKIYIDNYNNKEYNFLNLHTKKTIQYEEKNSFCLSW